MYFVAKQRSICGLLRFEEQKASSLEISLIALQAADEYFLLGGAKAWGAYFPSLYRNSFAITTIIFS
jgi:hypothetical protein